MSFRGFWDDNDVEKTTTEERRGYDMIRSGKHFSFASQYFFSHFEWSLKVPMLAYLCCWTKNKKIVQIFKGAEFVLAMIEAIPPKKNIR